MGAVLTLTVTDGKGAGSVFRFRRFCRMLVGRSHDADIRLDDPSVSRHHAVLDINPPFCQIQDLTYTGGACNLPRVNGERVRVRELYDGDMITFGHTHLRCAVEWGDRSANPESSPSMRPGPASGFLLKCTQCGRDLSIDANFEGPVPGVTEAAYLCRDCLPEGDDSAGTVIGDYELRRTLGKGRMGVVSLAWHLRAKILVALKQIKDLGGEPVNRRFVREVRVLRRVSHPGVVRFIDSGMHEGRPFIVTEYIAGTSLGDQQPFVPWTPQTAVPLIAKVIDTLHDMHLSFLVHGDIRPHNILIGNSGKNSLMSRNPKLNEFALALFYERAGLSKNVAPGERVKLLPFIAPERAGSGTRPSVLSDVYSVGATLFYLLSGQSPFSFPRQDEVRLFDDGRKPFRSPVEAVRALRKAERILFPDEMVKGERPVSILDRNPKVPAKIAAVVDRAVAKDPKARFQTASEFRDALRTAAHSDGIGYE